MALRGYIAKTKKANWLAVAGAVPVRAARRPARQPKPRKPVRRRSAARASEERLYREEARAFVAEAVARGGRCPVVAAVPELRGGTKYGHPISDRLSENHHRFGRRGRLLRWKPGWMPVSKQGHRALHNTHVALAKELSWLAPGGIWDDYERAVAWVAANENHQPKE